MFGLGLPELIIIFVIALVVFGPKKLPDLGKSIGRAMAEFKKTQQEFQATVQAEMKEVEKTTNLEELKKLGTLDEPSAYKEADEGKPVETQGAENKTDLTPEEKPDQNKGEGATGNG
jgi:TatA/E family protein of Tat protein translocase